MRTKDFWYFLPGELIAQHPLAKRDQSRLLVLNRQSGILEHRRFRDLLAYLRPDDLLVLNDARALQARRHAVARGSGRDWEVQWLEESGVYEGCAMVRPGQSRWLHARRT